MAKTYYDHDGDGSQGHAHALNLKESGLDGFVKLIPQCLLQKSGAVFYSGRKAFSNRSPLYILGLNPGGSPTEQAGDTVERHTCGVLKKPEYWSEYQDEIWRGTSKGTSGMQPSVASHADRLLLRAVLARVTFSRMSFAFAVQMKGLGF